jgi:5,10-methylenetetrahydromethanopterin reductase
MATATPEPAEVLDDLSAYVIGGRVSLVCDDSDHESDCRTPAQGILDGVEAERIGFRRVFLSERWNLKEAGVILGAIAARTQRIDIASGVITTPARHPLHMAGMAATFQAAFGPRLVLGLGRGNPGWLRGAGMDMVGYRGLEDYVGVLRQLWRGQTVSYSGPLGDFPHLELEDVHADFAAPPVWFGTLGQGLRRRTPAAGIHAGCHAHHRRQVARRVRSGRS